MRQFVMMVTALAASLRRRLSGIPWEARVFAALLAVGLAASSVSVVGMYACGGGMLVLACFVVVDRLGL